MAKVKSSKQEMPESCPKFEEFLLYLTRLLNKQAPGGPEAVPAVQGHNSGNPGTGTGAGTGNTGS